ncbi:hypothetical protein [Sorangium sp. So ce834]|uniref:hypothetical protein n=1 Tax=Sorangium sp. So ce834 TaxID=3133321 RepID=UPI003F647663
MEDAVDELRRVPLRPGELARRGHARAQIRDLLGEPVELPAGDDREVARAHPGAEAGHEATLARHDEERPARGIVERDRDPLCAVGEPGAAEEVLDEAVIAVERERELDVRERDAIEPGQEVMLMSHGRERILAAWAMRARAPQRSIPAVGSSQRSLQALRWRLGGLAW